jgi:hypothetical protein
MDNDQATLNEPAEVEISMEDSIRASLEEIRSRDKEPTETPAEVPTETATEEKPARVRGADGKFAKSDASGTPNDGGNPDATAAPAAADAVQPGAATEPAATTVQPPASWKGTAKAKFAALDPEIQQEVLRREGDFHKGVEQYKQAAGFGQEVHKAIQPYMQTLQGLQQQGVTPAAAIERLMNHDHVLRYGTQEQKREAVARLVQAYGVDMTQALPYVDPQVEQYKQEIARRDQMLQQFTQTQAQREQAELNSQIEAARQGKEYFDEVRPHMAALLQAGQAKDLNDAYDQAVWARPDLRQAMLAKQQEALRIEQAEKAKAAKQAAAVNVSARGTFPAAKAVPDMKEDIRANYRRLMGQA